MYLYICVCVGRGKRMTGRNGHGMRMVRRRVGVQFVGMGWYVSGFVCFGVYLLATSKVPSAVTESVKHAPHMWEIRSLLPGRVKPKNVKSDTSHFLAWNLASIGSGKD